MIEFVSSNCQISNFKAHSSSSRVHNLDMKLLQFQSTRKTSRTLKHTLILKISAGLPLRVAKTIRSGQHKTLLLRSGNFPKNSPVET